MGEGAHKYGTRSQANTGRGAEILRKKGDTEGDYSRAQGATLRKEESGIRYSDIENGRSVDATGKVVFSSKGTNHSVRIGNRTNNVTTHNHPNDQYRNRNSIAARIGQSFSGTDIANAISSDSAGTRAVTPGYTFNISRPKEGWPKVSAKQIKSTYTRAFNKFRREYVSYEARGDRERDRAWTMANHKAAEAVAKKYGLKYTRRKN